MFTIKQTPEFAGWLFSVRDGLTRGGLARRLERRLEKMSIGNLGDRVKR